MALGSSAGRTVTVRLYSNQSPAQLTLVRGGASSVVNAGNPTMHVTGRWQVRTPGQDWLALSLRLEIGREGGQVALRITVRLEEYVGGVLDGERGGLGSEELL